MKASKYASIWWSTDYQVRTADSFKEQCKIVQKSLLEHDFGKYLDHFQRQFSKFLK